MQSSIKPSEVVLFAPSSRIQDVNSGSFWRSIAAGVAMSVAGCISGCGSTPGSVDAGEELPGGENVRIIKVVVDGEGGDGECPFEGPICASIVFDEKQIADR